MKITKEQLKQIIKEELEGVLQEQGRPDSVSRRQAMRRGYRHSAIRHPVPRPTPGAVARGLGRLAGPAGLGYMAAEVVGPRLPFGIGDKYQLGRDYITGGKEAAYDTWKRQQSAAGAEAPFDYDQMSQAEEVLEEPGPPGFIPSGDADFDAWQLARSAEHDRSQQQRLKDIGTKE